MADNAGDKRTGSYGTLRERFQAPVFYSFTLFLARKKLPSNLDTLNASSMPSVH